MEKRCRKDGREKMIKEGMTSRSILEDLAYMRGTEGVR